MSDKPKLMERFRDVFRDGIDQFRSIFIQIKNISSICVTKFLLSILFIQGAALYPNNPRIQEYAAKNLKTMDKYPDASEKILNSQHLKQRLLATEKTIADVKRDQKKPTK